MRYAYCLLSAMLFSPACAGWPPTKMEPAEAYGSGPHATISSAPSYTAGTNYTRTTSPDGSTIFVCSNGSTLPGDLVPPSRTPAC